MKRISIVGTTGAGKTTLAKLVGKRLGTPVTELDAINWQRNWTPLAPDELLERVEAIVSVDRWVIEGGYSAVTTTIWKRADTLIWIDYSLAVVLSLLVRRTLNRVTYKEALWSGNMESLGRTLSRDSIIVWLFRTYWRKKRQYSEMIANNPYPQMQIIRLRSPSETAKWLDDLK